MTNWEGKTLGDISSNVSYGYTASASLEKIGPKFLRITDISNDAINWERVPYCKISENDFKKYQLHYGDIVIARTGATTGANKYFKENIDAVYASYLIRFEIDKQKANSNFIYYYMQSSAYKGFINNYISGAAQPGINASVLSKFKMVIPDLPTQEKIGNILSAYDDLIENNNKRIALLEKAAQELYKEWFVRFRFPGYESTKFENGLPQGWKRQMLSQVASVTYGYAFKSKNFCDDSSLNPVVRIRDILKNDTDTYTPELCDSKYLIKENAILIGMDGIFHMCLWNGEKAYLNQRVVMVESKLENFCNYLLYFSVQPQIKYWEQIIAGTTVAHLGDKHLKKVSVLIPDKATLSFANDIFNNFMMQKNKLLLANRNLAKQRDLLLPRLMSGKLEV